MKLVAWTAAVAAAFWALARFGPTLPGWLFWFLAIAVWMTGNVVILVGETKRWRLLAETLGLRPEKPIESAIQWLGMPDLVGTHRGRRVALRTFRSGGQGGGRSVDWTVIQAEMASAAGMGLDLRSRNWRVGGSSVPGGTIFETHDAALDGAVVVQTDDPPRAGQVLTGEVRERVLALDVPHRTFVDQNRVEQRVRTRLLARERVARHLDAVVALANEVERTS